MSLQVAFGYCSVGIPSLQFSDNGDFPSEGSDEDECRNMLKHETRPAKYVVIA